MQTDLFQFSGAQRRQQSVGNQDGRMERAADHGGGTLVHNRDPGLALHSAPVQRLPHERFEGWWRINGLSATKIQHDEAQDQPPQHQQRRRGPEFGQHLRPSRLMDWDGGDCGPLRKRNGTKWNVGATCGHRMEFRPQSGSAHRNGNGCGSRTPRQIESGQDRHDGENCPPDSVARRRVENAAREPQHQPDNGCEQYARYEAIHHGHEYRVHFPASSMRLRSRCNCRAFSFLPSMRLSSNCSGEFSKKRRSRCATALSLASSRATTGS